MGSASIPLSERSKQVLVYAEDEARAHGHLRVGDEHILLGLLRVPDSAAAQILTELGVTNALVHALVVRGTETGTGDPEAALPHAPSVQRTLELAEARARRLGHKGVGTELVLLGLLESGGGRSSSVHSRLGITLEAAEASLRRLLAHKRSK